VLEVATKLDYVAHGAAQSLITRVTRNPWRDPARRPRRVLLRAGARIDLVSRARPATICWCPAFHSDSRDLAAILQATRGRVDGLIVMSPEADVEVLRHSLGEPVPVVLLNCAIESAEHDATRRRQLRRRARRTSKVEVASSGSARLSAKEDNEGNIDKNHVAYTAR